MEGGSGGVSLGLMITLVTILIISNFIICLSACEYHFNFASTGAHELMLKLNYFSHMVPDH